MCCLLIESAHNLLFSVFITAIYAGMGFHDYQLTLTGISCYVPETWMIITRSISNSIFHFTILAGGYWISKHATTDAARIAGALLFYVFISGMVMNLSIAVVTHQLPFIVHFDYDKWSNVPVAFFGNFYVFRVFEVLVFYIAKALYIYWAYCIVFKFWSPAFRKMVFTFGLVACGIGWIIWYFWLGPLIF